MLDLSRPLGSIEGLTLFGDHERADLAYYLPDEVGVRTLDAGRLDLNMQIFFPDEAVAGQPAALDAAVGSILSLGVRCSVSPDRLAAASRALATRLNLESLTLVTPPWEDGRVSLLLLDSDGQRAANPADTLVRDVVGSSRPSLSDTLLGALFHARMDRIATAMIASALEGRTAANIAVLYDLSFAALRPTVKLRMSADLNRCAEYFSAGVGVQIYYVSADVRATFGKMREDGVIKIDQVVEADDQESQRLIAEAVQDFYDTLMRELFTPTVSPAAALGPLGNLAGAMDASIVKLSFSYTRVEHARVIEVDYRSRSATRRTHNPAAHLDVAAHQTHGASLVQRVPLSAAWRQLSVEVAAPEAFEDPLLRQLRVVIWRGRDGELAPTRARDGGLRMPESAAPLADLAFARTDAAPRTLQIVMQPDEPAFYRWQAKLTYGPADEVDSPAELWSEPHSSGSMDLDLFPSVLAPSRKLTLTWGAMDASMVRGTDASLRALAHDGSVVSSRTLSVDAANPTRTWAVRRAEGTPITLQGALTYRFADGTSFESERCVLRDPDWTANDPFMSRVSMAVLVAAAPADLLEVIVVLSYLDAATGYARTQRLRLTAPEFSAADISFPVLRPGDRVQWEATAIRGSGVMVRLGQGETAGGTLVLPFTATRNIRVEWLGPAPAELGLRFLRATFRARTGDGDLVDTKTLEWRGTATGPQTVSLANEPSLEWQVEKRFEDGRRELVPFQGVDSDLLAVNG
ncbi:MAG: hypothetical protein ABW352_22805 [Polyangiales bacterium]